MVKSHFDQLAFNFFLSGQKDKYEEIIIKTNDFFVTIFIFNRLLNFFLLSKIEKNRNFLFKLIQKLN